MKEGRKERKEGECKNIIKRSKNELPTLHKKEIKVIKKMADSIFKK